MKVCIECYSDSPTTTPLLNATECLENHIQYICGTCGRCICIEPDKRRGLRRYNFPFSTLEKAKLYLRTADFIEKKCCGVYELKDQNGRISYKIFSTNKDLETYLKQNKSKMCFSGKPIFSQKTYQEFPDTIIKYLTKQEVTNYLLKSKS